MASIGRIRSTRQLPSPGSCCCGAKCGSSDTGPAEVIDSMNRSNLIPPSFRQPKVASVLQPIHLKEYLLVESGNSPRVRMADCGD